MCPSNNLSEGKTFYSWFRNWFRSVKTSYILDLMVGEDRIEYIKQGEIKQILYQCVSMIDIKGRSRGK